MGTGAITPYVDVAQLVLYLFWIFFAGIVYYLVRENHREGYPMEVEGDRGTVSGWPVPQPKSYLLRDGSVTIKPDGMAPVTNYSADTAHGYIGAPLVPTGNPLTAGIGPGAWAERADHPDIDMDGKPRLVPLRLMPERGVSTRDPDPRGKPVWGADGEVGGTVTDLWLDYCEMSFRYLEIEVATESGTRHVLLPIPFARIGRDGVTVGAILGHQFAGVPGTRSDQEVTLLEEEKIAAYYGAGLLYAEPGRAEPLV